VSGSLGRYRVMAVLVGIGLLALVGVAMPLKYLADSTTVIGVVGPIHGLLYFGYLLTVADLGFKAGWSLPRIVRIMLAGAVPLLSFKVERDLTREIQAQDAELEPSA
jgi:integral membrane protein